MRNGIYIRRELTQSYFSSKKKFVSVGTREVLQGRLLHFTLGNNWYPGTGLGHLGRGHLGRGQLGRGHLGLGHLGREHLGRGHLGLGHLGPCL